MVDVLSKKLGEANQSSNDFVQKLTELDELIDEERRKWKLQVVCVNLPNSLKYNMSIFSLIE